MSTPVRIQVENVLRIIDVNREDVSEQTLDFLLENHVVFKDQMRSMNEHIVSITEPLEEGIPFGKYRQEITNELEKLAELLVEYDASYVRFIKF